MPLPLRRFQVLLLLTLLFAINVQPGYAEGAIYQIDCGGRAASPPNPIGFAADGYASGGDKYTTSDDIDTSGVAMPAPSATYQSERYGKTFTYTLPGFTPGVSYPVRLHFVELKYDGTLYQGHHRRFDVSINGTQVLSAFEIFQLTGVLDKAVTVALTATADADGKIAITFDGGTDTAVCQAIEVNAGPNVQFQQSARYSGFDNYTNPPWLIVPLMGTNTAQAVIAPSNLASTVGFSSEDASVVTVSPSSASTSPQTITLTGVSKGEKNVTASLGTQSSVLRASVKSKRVVTVAFHFIYDTAHDIDTARPQTDPDVLLQEANQIWNVQSNVYFVKGLVDSATYSGDLGTYVDSSEINAVSNLTYDPNLSDKDVYFVKGTKSGNPLKVDDAFTSSGKYIFFSDLSGSLSGHVLAHELGHSLGISGDYKDAASHDLLMYFDDSGGSAIKKIEADTTNAN